MTDYRILYIDNKILLTKYNSETEEHKKIFEFENKTDFEDFLLEFRIIKDDYWKNQDKLKNKKGK